MFTHILLPTDGSPRSEQTIARGVELARQLGATVTGLCVVPTPPAIVYDTEVPLEAREKSAAAARAYAARNLEQVAAAARLAGVPCETLIETGDYPYEAIIAVATRRGCDLIMMASHGRRGVKALLLGSETQKVLTHSTIPVLVFRG
jgi:nucleotide-binding universal stress UspA family protein